jgi:hypothetical protein
MQELKHKFRESFKPLKTNVSRKIFSDYVDIGPTGIVCFIAREQTFPGLIMGA